jgi:hypothetical protein
MSTRRTNKNTQPAPQPEPENLFGTAADDEMRTTLMDLRRIMGDQDYLVFLQGQVLFYTIAAPVSEDGGKAARKAAFFAEVYAATIDTVE